MNKKVKGETPSSVPPAKAGNAKAKTQKTARKGGSPKAAKESAPEAPRFDFIGKVESIAVSGAAGSETFAFGLRGRRGARQTFRLETAEKFALNVMAPLVTAAHATGAKIGVRVREHGTNMPVVLEVESRPHLGKRD
jgi:hypothetical protein